MNAPDDIPPAARKSLAKIREHIAAINRLEADIARSKWQAPIIMMLAVLGMVWAISMIVASLTALGILDP